MAKKEKLATSVSAALAAGLAGERERLPSRSTDQKCILFMDPGLKIWQILISYGEYGCSANLW